MDDLDALADQEGWHMEGFAARGHYSGADERYSIEVYAPNECVLYWRVKSDSDIAVPVGRNTVPDPLRERIRHDLEIAGIDPTIEQRQL